MTAQKSALKVLVAGPADAGAVARTLTFAFFGGDLAPWLVRDPLERNRIYPEYFAMIAEHALAHGTIEITQDRKGAAIWYPVGDGPVPQLPGYSDRLGRVTRPYTARFVALDDDMARHHPYTRSHEYLAFLGVFPGIQRCGYATRLLHHHHQYLDTTGTPAYLEATGPGTRGLYLRHGYRAHRLPYAIAGTGPLLHPMWREPAARPAGTGIRSDQRGR